MKKNRERSSVPKWIIRNLKFYGNCACGYEIVSKYGESKLINELINLGLKCNLRIVTETGKIITRKKHYPRNAYYILEVDKVLITNETN